MNVSEYIMDRLAKEGVEKIFMVSGGGGMYLIEALGQNPNIKHVCNHHEQASVMAAEGYQRATQNLGVALVTTGPASTNALTGVCCAWNDSIPLLVLSGQAKTATLVGNTGMRQRGTHEVNIVPIVKPVTKYAVTVMDARKIRYHLEKALYLAKNGRPGPVWLDIPLDIQQAQINPDELETYVPENQQEYDYKLDELLSLLNSSKRPIFIAGCGLKLSKQNKLFLNLADEFNIPIVTTKNGFDIVANDNRLLAGRIGINGQRAANIAVQNADLIIAIGARLPLVTVGYETNLFGKNAKKVLVDVDDAQLEYAHIPLDLKIKADLKYFVEKFYEKLIQSNFSYDSSKWLYKINNLKKSYPVITDEILKQKKYVNSYYFFDILSDVMNADDILVTDQGATFYSFTPAFKVKENQLAYTNGGFSPMGYGLPASIGSCFAKDGNRVFSVNGDGGLQMNIQELQTVIHNKLNMKIFVFNNDGYLSIKHTQTTFFDGHFVGSDPKSGVSCPDTIKIAKAYGFKHFRIKNNKDVKKTLLKITKTKGPVLTEVMIDPMQAFLPKVTSKRLEDGTMISSSLENMAPFLPEKELEEVMKNEED